MKTILILLLSVLALSAQVPPVYPPAKAMHQIPCRIVRTETGWIYIEWDSKPGRRYLVMEQLPTISGSYWHWRKSVDAAEEGTITIYDPPWYIVNKKPLTIQLYKVYEYEQTYKSP